MSSKDKKRKSVERTKPNKSKKNEPQPEIIQVKQPLSRGNQNANSNKNTQVVQIVFPPDTEIRKVRKKKKGKSSATKKKEKEREELLNQLKSKLEEYDTIQQEAQKRNIKIPSELGINIINEGDLRTNEDIENYINDVVNKIAKLKELLEQSQTPSMGLRMGLPMRMGAGIQQLPSLPPQINMNIPTQPQNNILPSPPAGSPPDKTKEQLDKIAKDIQKKLDDKGVDVPGSSPFSPSSPSVVPGSQEPIKEGQLTEQEIKVGDKYVKVLAPPGWEMFQKQFERYLNNVAYETGQNEILPGIFHIPLDKENMLINDRDKLQKDYQVWLNGLERNQSAYIIQNKDLLGSIHKLMISNLTMLPQEAVKPVFKQQNIPFEEITGGNEVPKLEQRIQSGGARPFKKKEDNDEYEKYNQKYADITNKLMKVKQEIQKLEGKTPSTAKLNQLNEEVNQLDTELGNLYDSLPTNVKIGVIGENDKAHQRFNDQRKAIANLQSPTSGSELSPPQPSVTPKQSNEKALEILQQYSSDPTSRMTPKIKVAVIQVLGNKFMDDIEKLKPAERKQRIEREIMPMLRGRENEGGGGFVF